MARFRRVETGLKLIPVDFEQQVLAGTFEFALCYLIDHEADLSGLEGRYRNGSTGAPVFAPAVLLKIWTGTRSVDAKRRGALSTVGRFGRLRRTGNRPAVDNAALLTARVLLPRGLATRHPASAAQMPPATGCPRTSGGVPCCSSRCTRPVPAEPRRECGSARRGRIRP